MRKPSVAGMFYEEEAGDLIEQIKKCYLDPYGPGNLPGKEKSKNGKSRIKGIIVPHAGYAYSGACAAFAYDEIAKAEKPDVYIIIGPSHKGFKTCISQEDWQTPLGIAEVDLDLGKEIGLPVDEKAHQNEHSIEVQIPMLQFVKKEFKFLPILVSHDMDFKKLAGMIKKAVTKTKKKVIYICSSDFTHYGPNFDYVPFVKEVPKQMKELDMEAFDFIKIGPKSFLDFVHEHKATICGALAIAALLDILKGSDIKLLKYYTSGDIVGDYSSAVGYCAITFT